MSATQNYALFGGMTWPLPDGGLEYQLRHGSMPLSRDERMRLASILAAYSALIGKTRVHREAAVRGIRAAMSQRAEASGENAPDTRNALLDNPEPSVSAHPSEEQR